MNYIASLLYGSDRNIERRNVSWNMAGSFIYALASMLLTIAAVQAAGEDEGGIFAFAFSTFGQHMFMVAYYGMRPFHITDISGRYTFGEYLALRKRTCAAAVAICCLYLGYEYLCGTYTVHKCAIIFLMVLYKVIDGYADVYESEFQRNGRLYLTGKSLTFRTCLSVCAFLALLIPTGQLLPACTAAVAAQVLGFVLFDTGVIRILPGTDWSRGEGKVRRLALDNRTLFLSAILDFYVFSAAKYAIDQNMADKYQALFAAIFMPTNVINLVAGFVIRPYVTILSDDWAEGRLSSFMGVVRRISAIIAGLTVLALSAAWLLGIPVLSLLYPKLGYMLADFRRGLQCLYQSVLLHAGHYGPEAGYLCRVCDCGGGGRPHLPGGGKKMRNLRRRPVLCGADGVPGTVFHGYDHVFLQRAEEKRCLILRWGR